MEAIKRTADVKDHKLTVCLPEDFEYSRVEVIILPCGPQATASGDAPSKWQMDFLSVSCWDEQSEGAKGNHGR